MVWNMLPLASQKLTSLGCQSEGVAATPKHFVANDVEKRRRFLTAEMTEQTLREIYLYPFQLILKLADPWAWMTRSVATFLTFPWRLQYCMEY